MENMRLRHIDAMRGIACLLVLFIHFCEKTSLIENSIFSYIDPGKIGVAMFFMISGFIIPYSLGNRRSQTISFLVSRFFRLYPVYWLSVLLGACSCLYIRCEGISIFQLIANITMLPAIFKQQGFFSIYWTLLVEFFFYALCIVLYKANCLKNINKIFALSFTLLLLSLLLAVLRKSTNLPFPVGIIFSISLMLFSSLLREWKINYDKQARYLSMIYLFLFALLFPIVCKMSYNASHILYIASYFSGILLFYVLAFNYRIASKIIIYIGSISYSIYLLHPFFVDIVYAKMGQRENFNISLFLIYFVSVVSVSSLSYFFVEKKGIAIGKKIIKKYFST